MDILETKLISELQANPRQSNRKLSKLLNVDEETIKRRIDKLVSSGTLILTVLPKLDELGYPYRFLMLVEVEQTKIHEIGAQLCQLPYIGFVAQWLGSPKFFIRGDFSSIESMIKFTEEKLGKIEGIKNIDTMFEYQRIKSTFLHTGNAQVTKTIATRTENTGVNRHDRELIVKLQNNARTSFKELASETRMSETTVIRRVKVLIKSGIIEFTAIPNVGALGFPVICKIRLQTKSGRIIETAKIISRYPDVNYVGIVSGPAPLILTLNSPSMEAASDFVNCELSKIEGIASVYSFSYLNVLVQSFAWLPE
ncbi:MAG TPA: Lrp/AsnC family transcriptional regulator [Dehalococcoidales bacterium]|nr:Lrp/AsnC family transcriptional regulator [Dehalococcoidales bacterium]